MEVYVSVLMITFNHEPYIKQAIEGVLMQKCDFPIELIIGEDYSTDNTRQICEEYALNNNEIKLLSSNINIGVIPNLIKILQACKGKYLALCEGDDYWTDPYKLQKQVDFLEANPDYGLVHGDVNHLEQDTGKMINAYNKTNNINILSGNIFEFLMKPSHSIKTMTACFKKDLFEKHYLQDNEIMSKEWRLIDISIWLTLASHTKIHYFDEVFATYRLLPESMSRSRNNIRQHQFNRLVYNVRDYYANKYNCSPQIKNTLFIYYNKMLLKDSLLLRDKKMAIKSIVQLIKMRKFGILDFLHYVYHYFIK